MFNDFKLPEKDLTPKKKIDISFDKIDVSIESKEMNIDNIPKKVIVNINHSKKSNTKLF